MAPSAESSAVPDLTTDYRKVSNRGAKRDAPTVQKDAEEQEVTKAFAEFVVRASQKDITSEVSIKLKALLLDYFGVCTAAGAAGESTSSIIAGVKAFGGFSTGDCSVFTKGSAYPKQYAALINGALCHTYDFDDTHGPAILHPGASVISASLAEAESRNLNGADLLLALTVGYEVAVRVGMALGAGAYKHGFHNTATAGIFGSIAAVCKLRKSSIDVVENALGLGVSKAAGSMQFLENGSWNKRLHPGFAAHDAILCVCLAEAGVHGAAKPIEGKYGALHNFSSSSDPSQLLTELGTKWHLLGTACKPFPACRMTHGQLEMAGTLRSKHAAEHGTPAQVVITLPPANHPVVGLPTPNKIHPETIVDAQFSAYYQFATAWLHGNTLGWSVYEHLDDPAIADLSDRISCAVDPSYRNLESKVTLAFDDGFIVEDEVVYPLGEPQRPFEWHTGVQKKFLGLAEPVYGPDKAAGICKVVESIERVSVQELMVQLARI